MSENGASKLLYLDISLYIMITFLVFSKLFDRFLGIGFPEMPYKIFEKLKRFLEIEEYVEIEEIYFGCC